MQPAAVVFDLFGTLLDIGALRSAAAAYTDDPAAFVATWREKQIGYAFAATLMNRYEDFDALTARALEYAALRHARHPADRAWSVLAQSWREVAAYPDAGPVLAELRHLGTRCIVLTNGTPATAAAALASAGFSDAVDVTLSVDAVRAYKPDPRVYALVTDYVGVPASELLFVTANGWDATGASEFGMRVAWCNRLAAPAETFGAKPAWTISDLHALSGIITATT